MIYIFNQINICISREQVFNFLSDFGNIPLWNYYVNEVKSISSNVNEKRKYRQTRVNDFQIFEVKEMKFPEYILIETTSESDIWFRRTFKLEPGLEGECILNDHFEIDLGYPNFLQQMFKSKIRNAVNENLNKLKELLETGNTILQDGRLSKLSLEKLNA